MSIYLEQGELDDYVKKYKQRLRESGLSEDEVSVRLESHLKTNVIILYTKEWQDKAFNELLWTIQNVEGGYWIVQEYCNMPHVEFEHYSQRARRSYEKNNISNNMAKKELSPENFENFKRFKELWKNLRIKGDTNDMTVTYDFKYKIKPKDL